MSKKNNRIKGVSEVVLRVKDLGHMITFYEETIGFDLDARFEGIAFLNITDEPEGYNQKLGLIDASWKPDHDSLSYHGLNPAHTTLHHFALFVSLEDFEVEKSRLENLGLKVNTAEHTRSHERSFYIPDPEGNVVEFVCYDESVQ